MLFLSIRYKINPTGKKYMMFNQLLKKLPVGVNVHKDIKHENNKKIYKFFS